MTGLAVIDSPDFFQDGFPYFKGIWMQAADLPLGQQTILKALAEERNDLQHLTGDIGLFRRHGQGSPAHFRRSRCSAATARRSVLRLHGGTHAPLGTTYQR